MGAKEKKAAKKSLKKASAQKAIVARSEDKDVDFLVRICNFISCSFSKSSILIQLHLERISSFC
jgi:hypothetical protein